MTEWHVMYFLDYGQFFGGAANTLLNQAILMKKAGLKITVVISDYLSKDLEKGYLHVCENSKVKWMQLTYPICSHTEDIDIISVLQNYESVKTSVAELKPDILHSVQINPIVELISRELNIPHVMNIYQLLPEFFSINYIDIFPHFIYVIPIILQKSGRSIWEQNRSVYEQRYINIAGLVLLKI